MSDVPTTFIGDWSKRVLATIDACVHPGKAMDVATIAQALSPASTWQGCPRTADLSPNGTLPAYRRMPLGVDGPGPYEALLILWPPGHATPVHDHQGLWGLEYVLDGVLEVESFVLTPEPAIHLEPRSTLIAGVGDYLVFSDADYAHRCRNLSKNRPALSLHVYGGSLDWYRSFHAEGEGWSWQLHQSIRNELPA